MAEPCSSSSSDLIASDEGQLAQLLDQDQQHPAVDDTNDDTLLANMEACFKAFDKDSDGLMTLSDFAALCRTLFRNEQGKAYAIEESRLQEMFDVFDRNQDGYVDFQEFAFCWKHWIKPIVRPVSALIIVDVQNDFITGSLSISQCPAQQNGQDVLKPTNKLLETVPFEVVFYSLDWHPDNHVSFIENVGKRKLHSSSQKKAEEAVTYDTVVFEGPPLNEQKLWPKHCVQNSWGAELHPAMKILENGILVHKGVHPDIDSYSAFWDNNKMSKTDLGSLMQKKKITDLYVCGLAYDVCVGATARDSLEHGYRTILIDDASRGISVDDILHTRDIITEKNGLVVHSSQVKDMVEGRDRRPELGYFQAMRLRQMLPQNGGIRDPSPDDNASPRDSVIFLT
ncbi:nicotinamidase-like [Daphnia pulicaria]|uniref:nicotinamidase-like n=1 Tax=Daphnia pulicaria TaxID=35523 RepID=UPI001EEAC921|nr:nicotinamidase-like [Daphnia pulicaria]